MNPVVDANTTHYRHYGLLRMASCVPAEARGNANPAAEVAKLHDLIFWRVTALSILEHR